MRACAPWGLGTCPWGYLTLAASQFGALWRKMVGFANEARGLVIAGAGFAYLSEGAYGVIFVDKTVGRVVKVYKRRSDEDHARAVFKAEIGAYRLAMISAAVASLVPGNFKVLSVNQVIDSKETDVTDEFFRDLAFEADFVDGQFQKFATVCENESLRVRNLFRGAGIYHTKDMSVTLDSNRVVVKAVDFATQEYVLSHSEFWR